MPSSVGRPRRLQPERRRRGDVHHVRPEPQHLRAEPGLRLEPDPEVAVERQRRAAGRVHREPGVRRGAGRRHQLGLVPLGGEVLEHPADRVGDAVDLREERLRDDQDTQLCVRHVSDGRAAGRNGKPSAAATTREPWVTGRVTVVTAGRLVRVKLTRRGLFRSGAVAGGAAAASGAAPASADSIWVSGPGSMTATRRRCRGQDHAGPHLRPRRRGRRRLPARGRGTPVSHTWSAPTSAARPAPTGPAGARR